VSEYAGKKPEQQTQFAKQPEQQQQQGVPGKQTSTSWMDTTQGLYDGKPKVGKVSLKPLFDDKQRARAELFYGLRCVSAQSTYQMVLAEKHADNLIKRPEEMSIIKTLLIAAVGKALEVVMMGALKGLKVAGAAANVLDEAKVEGVKGSEANEKILGIDASKVEALVALGSDKAKEKVTEQQLDSKGEAQNEEQLDRSAYLGWLADSTVEHFQHLREDKLATMTDAELILAILAFDHTRWNHTVISAQIDALVAQYMSSHAREIGHKTETKTVATDGDHPMHDMRKETRVAWVLNGRKEQQLVYVTKEYDMSQSNARPGAAYTADENALGVEEKGEWHGETRSEQSLTQPMTVTGAKPETDMEFLGPVEDNLKSVALAAHKKRWLQEPQLIMRMADNQWHAVGPRTK
jgi:hypothetical protein